MRRVSAVAVAAAIGGLMTCLAAPAQAGDYNVPDGQNNVGGKSVKMSGADKITIGAGGSLKIFDDSVLEQKNSGYNILIDNRGTIENPTGNGRAIKFKTGSSLGFEIRNAEGAIIRSAKDAIRVEQSVSSGSITVTNNGLIETLGVNGNSGQAIDFGSVGGSTSISIVNNATGIMRTADADAIRPGDGAVVKNYGQIISNNYQSNTGADGIDFQTSRSGTVYNYEGGVISGGRHGINLGAGSQDNSVTVNNYGTITGRNGSGFGSDASGVVNNWGRITGTVDSNPDIAVGDGDGVDIDYKATIVNYGIIEGTGSKGEKDGHHNASEGIAIGGGTVDNKKGALISGLDHGITVDDSNQSNAPYAVEITNAGTITGVQGYGILIRSDKDNVVTNSGTITGGNGKAIVFGSGNDTLNILTGSIINGSVDGGDGVDTVNLSGTGTFAGTINFEGLNVRDGRWVLTGNESYSQGVTVFSGATLVEMGALNAAVTVQAGATLAGTGTVGALALAGTVAPGANAGDIGTLKVNGNAQFASTARYIVDARPSGATDTIAITGKATLAGAVFVAAQSGQWPPIGRATILQADGGIAGRFSGATTNLAFLTPSLLYGTGSVELVMARNDVRFDSVAATGNQRAVAAAFNAVTQGTPMAFALLGQTAGGAQQAFNALSGEGLAAAAAGAQQSNTQFGSGIMSQILAPASGTAAAATGASGGPMALGMGEARRNGLAGSAEPSRLRMWASGFNQAARLEGDPSVGTATVANRTSGVMAGADWRLSSTATIGLASGFSEGANWTADRQTNVATTGYHAGAYGVTRFGGFYLAGLLSAGAYDNTSKRTVEAFGVREAERATFSSTVLSLRAEAGHTFKTSVADITPFAGVSFARYFSDGYQETAITPVTPPGPLGLTVAGARMDAMPVTLGVRVATTQQHPAGWILRPAASLAWVHNVTTEQRLDASFNAFPAAGFSVSGTRADRDMLQAKASLGVELASGVQIAGELATDQGPRTQSLSASGQVRINW